MLSWPSILVHLQKKFCEIYNFGCCQVENETNEGDYNDRNRKSKKNARSLQELYERKRGEEEKARKEKEAVLQAKKEERQRAEARRKDLKGKMFKKTRSGQPVMKYRIEHLLETIQGPTT